MTVASQVKQTLSSLKGVEATLNAFALKSESEEAQKVFRETCLVTRRIVTDIEKRVGELERQEPQYKGF